ncbi:MAG: lmo0937 family membrane protein [Planctomycetes bacterium]|nr:lmo0937 family membrane protein [Planctomycetota bacterium]
MNSLSAVLWTIAAILLVFWIVGLIAQATFGGLIHLLLVLIVAAVAIEVVRIVSRPKPQ